MTQEQYSIELLNQTHEKSFFSCGIDSLDDFLKTQASQQAKKNLSVTYVLLEKSILKVIGYYSLSSTSISLDLLPKDVAKKLPRYPSLPATLLGRLAVDKAYQSKKLGKILLYDALKKSLEYSRVVGSMAVIVDAINDSANAFYEKFGFIKLSNCKDKLFLPTLTIRILVEK